MKIYHNPSCSKSRICLDVLNEQKLDFEVVTYIKSPLTKTQLEDLLLKLQLKPSELVRKNESVFKESAKLKALTEQEILQLMVENPKLIERPIVLKNAKAVVARPTERILEVL